MASGNASPNGRSRSAYDVIKGMSSPTPGRLPWKIVIAAASAGTLGFLLGLSVSLSSSSARTPQLCAEMGEQGEAPGVPDLAVRRDTSDEETCALGGWRQYGEYYGQCDLCSLTFAQVLSAVQQPHRCHKDTFWGGRWQPALSLSQLPKEEGEEGTLCILICAHHIPCRSPPCLLGIHARPGTSDALVLRDIFFAGALNLDKYPLPQVQAVLDAGANIGAASVYFSLLYPKSTVVAVEASAANHALLLRNVRGFPNVRPVHAAVWSSVVLLCLVHGQRDVPVMPEYAFTVAPCSQEKQQALGQLEGMPIPLLLGKFGLDHFDVLKVDIEGGEGEVFGSSSDVSFLTQGKLAIMEVHDDMWQGAGKTVEAAFKQLGRWHLAEKRGEHIIWVAK